MRYFLSAGEASGDLHGANLIRELAKTDPSAGFCFLGGSKMAAAAGAEPVIDYSRMAFMGFSEVIRNLPRIARNLSEARRALLRFAPDALILIDYPDFNLKLAKTAHEAGIPVYYYIPPKVWAWKEYRVKTIRRLCRRVFGIFPFEPAFYGRHGVEAIYAGNPSVEEIDNFLKHCPSRSDFIAEHDLTNRPVIALLPGSRMSEIRNNLPVMATAVQPLRGFQAVVGAAPGISLEVYRRYTNLPIVERASYALMAHAEAALVTSGTATLECALIGTPQVVCYRANGSRLSYELMKRLLKVKHVSLPNLIAGRTVIPEMLLHECTPALVERQLRNILPDAPGRNDQLVGYGEMRALLGTQNCAASTAAVIVSDLKNRTSK